MYKVGIIGGAGYTAGELIRILVSHPDVMLSAVQSESSAGKHLWEVHSGLIADTDLRFVPDLDPASVDVLFMCSAHGMSRQYWEKHALPPDTLVIDLAQDYRDESDGYVYGLPEWQKARIVSASRVANPGCFATAIQLALLPLAAAGMLCDEVHVTAVTGSTGAGVKPGPTTHFSWRSDNISAYKVFTHQHLAEIRRTICALQPDFDWDINFVPLRGDFARGIFASVYTTCPLDAEEALRLYRDYYAQAAFTHVCTMPVDLKQVTGTNKCLLYPEKHSSKLVISAVLDNLLKGASGQAVQNMNIGLGLEESSGLRLKATAF